MTDTPSMKTLWLLRHAKSSWKDASLADHDRPLKKRGRKAAVVIAGVLAEQGPFPDAVLCSTAVRARETWQMVSDTIAPQRTVPSAEYRAELYHASPETMRDIIAGLPDDHTAVLLIGHNPGLEEFIWEITATETEIPTAALVRIDFTADSWATAATTGKGTLAGLWRPRELE